jgi:CheY-like chemotaxis protein
VSEQLLVAVDDLFFLARIQQTAKLLGISVSQTPLPDLAARAAELHPAAVLLDLNHSSGKAVETAAAFKRDPALASIPVIGFLSHVQTDLAQAAHAAGCDQVMARSAFSRNLPELLQKLAAPQP